MSERTGLFKVGTTAFGGTPNNSTDKDEILGGFVDTGCLWNARCGWMNPHLRCLRHFACSVTLG